jgi:hypothetical protein
MAEQDHPKEEHLVHDAMVLPDSDLAEVVIGFEVTGDERGKPSKAFRMSMSVANKLLNELNAAIHEHKAF